MYEWSRVIFAKKSKFHDAGGPDTVVSPIPNPPHTGGNRKDATTLNMKIMATILKFDTTTLTWSQVGNMTRVRAFHGASVYNSALIPYEYCKS